MHGPFPDGPPPQPHDDVIGVGTVDSDDCMLTKKVVCSTGAALLATGVDSVIVSAGAA